MSHSENHRGRTRRSRTLRTTKRPGQSSRQLLVESLEERRVLALVADSVAEFSGVQGQNNWEYLRATPSAASTPQLTAATPLVWSGSDWNGPGSFNTPLLTAAGGHPSDSNQWAVRRYTSEVTGLVTLSGTLQHTQVGGSDGTYGRLYLNNSQFFAKATPQNLSVAGPIY
ncbi:MAG TPA: hypothetical protein VL096_05360, partial [Pirellulaceae bacterium]|nr:hypothetical protein [Pirellulaceae bacterium]